MSHEAWVFLDILIVCITLLICMAMYANIFENNSDSKE